MDENVKEKAAISVTAENETDANVMETEATETLKYKKSPVEIACYAVSAALLLYACYQGGSIVNEINQYYGSMGMSAKFSEYLMYILQSAMGTLINAALIFMAGYILSAVRKLNPDNYAKVEAKKEKPQAVAEEAIIEEADTEPNTEADEEAEDNAAEKDGEK